MDLKALIFDFDGTILDTEYADFEAWRRVYQQFGADIVLSDWISCFGTLENTFNPQKDLSQKIDRLIESDVLFSLYHEKFNTILQDLPLLPGLLTYINYSQENQLKLAIASGGRGDFIRKQLYRLGIYHHFSQVCTFEDTYKSKPDPSIYMRVLEKLGISPSQAITFEDSPHGVKAAQSAKIFCIGVKNKVNQHLTHFKPDLLINSLEEWAPECLLARIGV